MLSGGRCGSMNDRDDSGSSGGGNNDSNSSIEVDRITLTFPIPKVT